VEAASAASFVERFGTGTEEAVKAFMDEIRSVCLLAKAKKDCFLDSPVAAEMGTLYPFIQVPCPGSRTSGVCLKSCRCRWTATIALGLMDAETLDRRLGRLPRSWVGARMR